VLLGIWSSSATSSTVINCSVTGCCVGGCGVTRTFLFLVGFYCCDLFKLGRDDSTKLYLVSVGGDSFEGITEIPGVGCAHRIEFNQAAIDAEGVHRLDKLMIHTTLPTEKVAGRVEKSLSAVVEVDFVGGHYQVSAVHARNRQDSLGGLTRADLARVPLEDVLRNVEQAVEDFQFAAREKGVELLPRKMVKLRHPGRRGYTDRFYARRFGLYLEFVTDRVTAPTAALAEAEGVPLSTAKKWIAEARRRGLATPAGQGKRGGELTQFGKDVLQ
jgi:hypothetical protein